MQTSMRGRFVLSGWTVLGALCVAPTLSRADDSPAPPGGGPAALFDRLDANHDGKLVSDEVPEDKRGLFDRLLKSNDKDSDGALNREEFVAGMKSGRPDREREPKSAAMMAGGLPSADEIFARMDANQDGKITAGEVPEQVRERFEQLLARFDKDSDGTLTKQEVTDGVAAMNQNLKPPGQQMRSPEMMFKYLDANNDGKLTSGEVPEERRDGFERLVKGFDADNDGALNLEEFKKGMEVVRQMQGLAGGQRPPGDSPGKSAENPDSPGKSAGNPDSPAAGRKLGERMRAARERGGMDPAKMAERMTERFKAMDKNNDGKLSADEFEGRKGMFDSLDANKDGFVDQEEMKAIGAKLRERAQNQSPSPESKPESKPNP